MTAPQQVEFKRPVILQPTVTKINVANFTEIIGTYYAFRESCVAKVSVAPKPLLRGKA